MKIQFDPQRDYVDVIIPDNDDAQLFCDIALEVVMGGASPSEDMRKVYQGYADQMKKDNHACWSRHLWDHAVRTIETPVGSIRVTFGVDLMTRLNLL